MTLSSPTLNEPGDLIMKSVIICDDLAFVAEANARLQRIGCAPDVRARWTVNSWPVTALNQAAIAEKTLIEAADAHLVMIQARHAHSLPFTLHLWLERWAALRQIEGAALAVIGNGIEPRFAKTSSPELSHLVRKHGLNFITDEGAVTKDATKLFVRFSRERELPLPIHQSRFAHAAAHDSYRCFGINE